MLKTHLALLIVSKTDRIEIFNDSLWGIILLNLALRIEAHHVVRAYLRNELEVVD